MHLVENEAVEYKPTSQSAFLPKDLKIGDVRQVKLNGESGHTLTWTDANTLTFDGDDHRKISFISDFGEAMLFWCDAHPTEKLPY
jgi:hypothetical protein